MTKNVKTIKEFKIEFDEKRIGWHIGYKKRSAEIEESIKKMIKQEKKRLNNLLQPAAIYRILDYEETNKHAIFQNAEKVVLCICSIGSKLEEESARLMKENEMLRGLVLDALGSEAVEKVAIQSERIIGQEAKKIDLWPSKRFSPGFGKWDIREQQFIFRMLPAQDIGVKLRESFMMVPRKSISFRINLFRDQNMEKKQ